MHFCPISVLHWYCVVWLEQHVWTRNYTSFIQIAKGKVWEIWFKLFLPLCLWLKKRSTRDLKGFFANRKQLSSFFVPWHSGPLQHFLIIARSFTKYPSCTSCLGWCYLHPDSLWKAHWVCWSGSDCPVGPAEPRLSHSFQGTTHTVLKFAETRCYYNY